MAEVILKDIVKIYPYSEKAEKKKAKAQGSEVKKTNLQITKKGVVAVQNFNLTIADGEFLVLVGPSGCGKSTTLRMIAGLEDISEGELYINGNLCNAVEPKDRDIAMVFQSYALYPHMTVFKNMEYPLTILKQRIPYEFEIEYLNWRNDVLAKTREKYLGPREPSRLTKFIYRTFKKGKEIPAPKNDKPRTVPAWIAKEEEANAAKIAACQEAIKNGEKEYVAKMSKGMREYKVLKTAEMLGITEYLKRKPKALSGGQRQRVAIGRAIVRNPNVLLMDEPLSNLDAKLRNEMRTEIIKLRKKISTTFIYVTHDQVEAMTLGDRIVVMRDGFIQQIGTPQEVFDNPRNIFVSSFIGTPKMNHFDGRLEREGNKYYAVLPSGYKVELSEEKCERLLANNVESQDVTLGVRPEHIRFEENGVPGIVTVSELMGGSTHLHVQVGEHDVIVIVPNNGKHLDYSGKTVRLGFDGACVHAFSLERPRKNLEFFYEDYHKKAEDAE
jgi:ABC-type sugar transport system ATPase subunit